MPNSMNIVPPVPEVTTGPQWANDINDILENNIAEHDHSSGKGVPVTPAGMNIDQDLSLNNHGLNDTKRIELQQLNSPPSPPANNTIYDLNGNLVFRNGNGTIIPITDQNGIAVNSFGGISGLSGTTGRAIYSAGTFQWEKNPSPSIQWANVEAGQTKIYSGNDTNPSYGVTIKTPDSLPANYDFKFASTAPPANAFLTMTTAGQLGYISQSLGIVDSMVSGGIAPKKISNISYSDGFDGLVHNSTAWFSLASFTMYTAGNTNPILCSIQGDPDGGVTLIAYASIQGASTTATNFLNYRITLYNQDTATTTNHAGQACAFDCVTSTPNININYNPIIIPPAAASSYIVTLQVSCDPGLTVTYHDPWFVATQL